jgi:Cu(I)/Ag(I) efflux system membrane fusion protein
MSDRPVHDHDEPLPEGEEHAPPGTHTMAIVRWALVALMALAALGAWVYFASESGLVQSEQRYHCPMHPQIVTTHRGECPICGMDLVPVPAGAGKGEPKPAAAGAGAAVVPAGAEARPLYTCPMHPAFVTPDPKGRCPDCGMKVVAKPGAAIAGAASGQALYTCPMHPAFVSPDPKARCPECGMKLVPRTAPAAPPATAVPGLAPVELSADRVQLSGIKTAVASRELLASTVKTPGFVTADERRVVSVTTRYSGWIEAVAGAQTGQLVAKGEVLATVYSPDLLNAQQVFLNAIRWTEGPTVTARPSTVNDLERDARARLELLGVSPQDLDTIAKTGKPMREMNVRSPARGYITRRSAIQGLYVSPGTELFQIADLSSVWVMADVYESEIGRVRVGQRAVFESSAYPGERFVGKVTFLYPTLSAGTRTLQARLEFQNPGLKLRPGLYGDVALELGAAEAVVVPRDALVDTGDVQYVFVALAGGRFEPRRVKPGWSGRDKIAILEGLQDGERVVASAGFLVDSESRLRAAIEGFGGAAAGTTPAAAPAGDAHAGH